MRVKTTDDVAIMARQRRLALGLNQAGLARRIGVSRKWVVDFENGKSSVELGLVLRALNALGLPVFLSDAPAVTAPKPQAIDIDAIVGRARDKT